MHELSAPGDVCDLVVVLSHQSFRQPPHQGVQGRHAAPRLQHQTARCETELHNVVALKQASE